MSEALILTPTQGRTDGELTTNVCLAFIVGSDRFRKGYLESRRCSRGTYLESYITKYTSIRR